MVGDHRDRGRDTGHHMLCHHHVPHRADGEARLRGAAVRRVVEYDLGVHREPSMRFIQFTSVHTGHPIHVRDDLIAGWTVEHGKTLLLLQGYDIDIEVKEPPEQVLRIIKEEYNGVQDKKGKPEFARGHGEVPEISTGREGKSGRRRGHHDPRGSRGDGGAARRTVGQLDKNTGDIDGPPCAPRGGGGPAPLTPHGA